MISQLLIMRYLSLLRTVRNQAIIIDIYTIYILLNKQFYFNKLLPVHNLGQYIFFYTMLMLCRCLNAVDKVSNKQYKYD